jgi:hypothetical protein
MGPVRSALTDAGIVDEAEAAADEAETAGSGDHNVAFDALKAFSIATLVVGGTGYAVVKGTMYALGVSDVSTRSSISLVMEC